MVWILRLITLHEHQKGLLLKKKKKKKMALSGRQQSKPLKLVQKLLNKSGKKTDLREFLGGSVVRTPCFHCWVHKFNLWSRN